MKALYKIFADVLLLAVLLTGCAQDTLPPPGSSGGIYLENMTTALTAQATKEIMSTEEIPAEPHETILPTIETNPAATEAPTEPEPIITEAPEIRPIPTEEPISTEAPPVPTEEPTESMVTEPPATTPTEPVETVAPQPIEIPACFEVEDGYPTDSLELAVALYYSAPEAMRQTIADCGTTIYMVNSTMLDPNLHYGVKGIIGVTFSNCKTIQLASGVVSVSRATIHEMAHLYDFVYNISSEDEFVAIYEEEYPSLYTPDGIAANYQYNKREYFAECTKLYVQHPDILKSWGPKTYSYLQNLFG